MKKVTTFIPILEGDEIIKDLRKRKKNKNKSIQEEIEGDYQKLIKQFDRLFEKQFGKMCPDFEPGCVQCRAHLIYNKFKQELYDGYVK